MVIDVMGRLTGQLGYRALIRRKTQLDMQGVTGSRFLVFRYALAVLGGGALG